MKLPRVSLSLSSHGLATRQGYFWYHVSSFSFSLPLQAPSVPLR